MLREHQYVRTGTGRELEKELEELTVTFYEPKEVSFKESGQIVKC